MNKREFVAQQRKMSDMRTTEMLEALEERRGQRCAQLVAHAVNVVDAIMGIGMTAAHHGKTADSEFVGRITQRAVEHMALMIGAMDENPDTVADVISTYWAVVDQRAGDVARTIMAAKK